MLIREATMNEIGAIIELRYELMDLDAHRESFFVRSGGAEANEDCRAEVFEYFMLVEAIQEGEMTEEVSREKVFKLLEGPGAR